MEVMTLHKITTQFLRLMNQNHIFNKTNDYFYKEKKINKLKKKINLILKNHNP